jgi:signal transduction histidine kinase
MASNNDGLWSKTAASSEVYLPPTFLQSIEFRLLVALLGLMVLFGFYWLRIRILTTQIKRRMFERLQERERIARDLHDTFFQSIQGLFLRINTGMKMLPEKEPARAIFLDALEKSDRVMAEGRELVLDLRADDPKVQNLPDALANLRQLDSAIPEPAYKVFSTGQVRALHPVCGSELLQIGREADQNAFKHAQAAAIEVELVYERDFLRMRIRDDGLGIDDEVARKGRRPGHLGLVAMNERATHIGARYRLLSKRGRGTEIEVEVPAEIAYVIRG